VGRGLRYAIAVPLLVALPALASVVMAAMLRRPAFPPKGPAAADARAGSAPPAQAAPFFVNQAWRRCQPSFAGSGR
jgi:hypothetical protein